jgi:hypothetical protein
MAVQAPALPAIATGFVRKLYRILHCVGANQLQATTRQYWKVRAFWK